MAAVRTDVATQPEFALESMEIAHDQVVVQGRWYGVIGRRFVRPALRIDGRRRVIATLEHKPWAALEGERWIAAFPYAGDEIDVATLEVAPDVTIDLTTGKTAAPKAAEKEKARQAKPARAKPNRDDLVEARHKAEREREDLRSQLNHVHGLREEALEERDEAIVARDAALQDAADRERRVLERASAEVDRVRAEAEAAREEHDDTYRRAVRAEQAAEAARAELTELREDGDEPAPGPADAIVESARLLGERDAAQAEADRLRRQLENAHSEGDPAGEERERLRAERDAARAEAERLRRQPDRAPAPPTETTREQPIARRDPEPTRELPPEHVTHAPGLAPRIRSRLDLPTDPGEDSDLGPRLVAAALIILMMVAFVLILGMVF